LSLMPLGGGPLQEIQRKPGVQTRFHFISDDSQLVYFSANDIERSSYAIYRWNVSTRTRETLFTEPGLWEVLNHDKNRLLLNKPLGNAHNEIYEWDLASRQLTPRLGQGESEEYDAAVGARPGTLLLRTNKLGDCRRLFEWRDDKFSPITADVKHDVARFGIDEARKHILVEVNENGYGRLRAYAARSYAPLSMPALPDA